ncbi:hypothetical protein M427DRAFT_139558 [Gonapodya prolifera JEL478]|uniref:Transcription factor domain-containing protein n=1 Tax=Gonapodya prolifera (strain JEL478) TaxID=1344416 RepID=A0A139A0W0_GONPJ|nr:hypothetical protein M427DRAFT_139558 [Gonapodya prolifera JEL478]|eukprot:KXS10416.1 hypothetical protein M427DRAFT_139558 [Gonapodya prolifera JEL478]
MPYQLQMADDVQATLPSATGETVVESDRQPTKKRPLRHVNSRLASLERALASPVLTVDKSPTRADTATNAYPFADQQLHRFPHFLPPEVCHKLLNRYFTGRPSHSTLIHSSMILDNKKPSAILNVGILALTSTLNSEHEHLRTLGKGMIVPKMKETLRNAAAWPSVDLVVGFVFGYYTNFALNTSSKDSILFVSQACAAIKLLAITTEEGLRTMFPDKDPPSGNRHGIPPPWILREQARRVVWLVYTLDAALSASTASRANLEADELYNLRIPCDDRVWSFRKPPWNEPPLDQHTLKSLLRPEPTTFGSLPVPPTVTLVGKVPCCLEPIVLYTYRLATQLHVRLEEQGMYVFMLPKTTVGEEVRSKINQIDIVINNLDSFFSYGGTAQTASALLSMALFSAVRAILRGPGIALERLWIKLVMESIWMRNFRAEAPRDLSLWIDQKRPGLGTQTGELLAAWSASPAFLDSIKDASCTAVLISQALQIDPDITLYISEGVRGWFGNALERTLQICGVILILAAALSLELGLPMDSQLVASAEIILRAGGPPVDVSEMVLRVVGELQQSPNFHPS